MKWELLFPSKYFKALDFEGGPVEYTIRAVLVEEIKSKQGTEKKPVLYVDENLEKSLVLNKTNAAIIAGMHGGEIEGWAGKRITLYMGKDRMGNKIVNCVRVQEGTNK